MGEAGQRLLGGNSPLPPEFAHWSRMALPPLSFHTAAVAFFFFNTPEKKGGLAEILIHLQLTTPCVHFELSFSSETSQIPSRLIRQQDFFFFKRGWPITAVV